MKKAVAEKKDVEELFSVNALWDELVRLYSTSGDLVGITAKTPKQGYFLSILNKLSCDADIDPMSGGVMDAYISEKIYFRFLGLARVLFSK